MLRILFTPEDVATLKYERMHRPHPRVQQKMWTVWLKACDVTHEQIGLLMGLSGNTVRAYLEEFVDGDSASRVIARAKPSECAPECDRPSIVCSERANVLMC